MARSRVAQYIEIDIDYCSLTYGVAPCTATLTGSPVTGTRKCFNTFKTCQDTAHFNNVPVTLTFAIASDFLPNSIEAIPSIKAIEFDPAKISLGKDLGQRASLKVTFFDHPHSDTGSGFDKYLADRDYDPYSKGSFWGKFRARNPYLIGRPLRWINRWIEDGVVVDSETHHFLIDSYASLTGDDQFQIVAKDVLKLADDDRAVAPAASTGYLQADITDSTTSATLSPAGVGNSEYAASGYLAIGGSEIVSFTRSADTLTITRAQLGTSASAHSAGDRVQTVLHYSAESPADIIYDLLANYANIDTSFLPQTTWQTEVSTYINRLFTAVIPAPFSVKKLVAELVQQAGLAIWWNDIDQTVGLRAIRGIPSNAATFNEDNYLKDSFDAQEQPDARISQILFYFGQINPLTSLTDNQNFASLAVTTDADAESNYGAASILEVYSRWVPQGGRTTADRISAILLARYVDPPRSFKFQLLRQSVPIEPALADGFQIEARSLQDDTGALVSVPAQAISVTPMGDILSIQAEELLGTFPDEDTSVHNITLDSNIHNVNLRTLHDSLFAEAVSGDTVVCTINAGVIVGSTSTANPAFDVGTWASGVVVIVVLNGRIEGAGGAGGDTGNTNGRAGGLALYSRSAFNCDASSGQIWGGGGGGGAYSLFGLVLGGGGGAGFDPGAGGAGHSDSGDPNGADGTTEAGGAGGQGTAGAGGNPGTGGTSSSGSGGSAGNAVDGDSYMTLGTYSSGTFTAGVTGTEDFAGSRVN